MEDKILVAYASTNGSTQEVAEAVAATLRESGLEVDILPLREIKTLTGYRAVVLGAPLYMFHWHKDAHQFLSRQRSALTSGLPVAIFAGGPIEEGKEEQWQEVRKQLDQELAKYPWLKPISIEIVGGKFDPAKLRFPYNLIPALKQMPPTDLRDWTAIHTWASQLAVQLQPALSREAVN